MATSRFIAWRASDRGYLLLLVVLVFLLAAVLTLLNVVYSVARVDGDSMSPALEDGDRLLITRGYSSPRAGDIVLFFAVEGDGSRTRLLKRVIALPGDSVEIVGDLAYVNGTLSQVAPTARVGGRGGRIGPFVVPEDSVYVLGDNRPSSLDSRFIGPIPLGSVIGRASAVILPLTRATRIDAAGDAS